MAALCPIMPGSGCWFSLAGFSRARFPQASAIADEPGSALSATPSPSNPFPSLPPAASADAASTITTCVSGYFRRMIAISSSLSKSGRRRSRNRIRHSLFSSLASASAPPAACSTGCHRPFRLRITCSRRAGFELAISAPPGHARPELSLLAPATPDRTTPDGTMIGKLGITLISVSHSV